MPDAIMVIDIGPDGAVATHPPSLELPVKVAPVDEDKKAKQFNTIRPALVTIACKSLPNHHFAFNSSFLASDQVVRNGFKKFAKLMQALQKQDPGNLGRFPPVSVFGHADPTGGDLYNKPLSGRRARSVYGLLTRNADIWDALFRKQDGTTDVWGTKSIEIMLGALQRTDDPNSFKNNGDARKQLFLDYMDFLCQDDTGQPFSLNPETDFIARGKGGKVLKGDMQGCSDFNPVLLLSQEEEDSLKGDKDLEEVRNQRYSADRRVLVYVFKHGTQVDPTKWPCPAATEPGDPCHFRFWSDADERRKRDPTHQRAFLRLADPLDKDEHPPIFFTTMACRFYHAFAEHSPCEVGLRLWVLHLRIRSGEKPIPLKNVRYVVKAGSADFAPVLRGTTGEDGELSIPVFDEKTQMTLKLDLFGVGDTKSDVSAGGSGSDSGGQQPAGAGNGAGTGSKPPKEGGVDPDAFEGEDKFQAFTLDAGALAAMDPDQDLPLQQRLYNLGLTNVKPGTLTADEQARAIRQYRATRKLDPNADDRAVRDAVEIEHEVPQNPPPPPDNDDDAAASGSGS